jgi:FG-GAP-like repeat
MRTVLFESRVSLSFVLFCTAIIGVPLATSTLAQESYRAQTSLRNRRVSASGINQQTAKTSASVGPQATSFLGWRNAAKRGPAVVQHFKNLARSGRFDAHLGTNWAMKDMRVATSIAAKPYVTSSTPASYPGMYLRPSLPAGALPSGIATGDFNGDGNVDWVISNAADNSLCLYLGKGDGTSQLPVIIPLQGQSPLAVVAGDLNGDNKLDLAVAEADTNTIGILYGNGDGTFQPEVQITLPVPPMTLALRDVNNDGKLDLVVGVQSDGLTVSGFFAVLLNNGGGSFGAPFYAPGSTGEIVSGLFLTFADANGDGKLDVAVSGADPEGTVLQLFWGNGDGTFAAGPVLETSNQFEDVAAPVYADLNGDGCPDIALATTGGSINVFFNDCKGNFSANPQSYGVGDAAYALAVADINGDGFPDIISGGMPYPPGEFYSAGNAVTVLLNDGTGNFGPARVFRGDAFPVGVAVASLKSGGLPYIVTANQNANSCTIYANDGTGNFGPPTGGYDGVYPEVDFISADINGDGKPDLAVVGPTGLLSVLLNQGNGQFSAYSFAALNSLVQDFVFGSFQKSNLLPDFIAMGINQSLPPSTSPQLVYLANQGNGQFAAPVTIPLSVSGGIFAFGTLAVGDFNRDGNLDLAVSTAGSGPNIQSQLTVFLGNGDGTFKSPPYQVSFGPAASEPIPIAMFVGDANGDGIPDIFVWTSYGEVAGDLFEFLGKGDGTFQPPVDVLQALYQMTMLDVNHDGRLDVIDVEPNGIAQAANPQVIVYLGQPNGTFSTTSTISPYSGAVPSWSTSTGVFPVGIWGGSTVGDFNGDGNVDLAMFVHGGLADTPLFAQFLSGNGDGTFTPTSDVLNYQALNPPGLAVWNLLGDNRAALVQNLGPTASYQIIPGASAPSLQIGFAESPIYTSADAVQIYLNVPSTSATTVSLTASDPNVHIPSTAQIPAGQLSASVPITLSSTMPVNQWFSITATAGGDTAIAYDYAAPGKAPAPFTLSVGIDWSEQGFYAAPAPGQVSAWSAAVGSNGLASSTLTFSCGSMPVGASCSSFAPTSIAVSPGAASYSLFTIATSACDSAWTISVHGDSNGRLRGSHILRGTECQ